MTLTSGTRLGPYEIVSPLGAGGMGEVYKATDTRLGRTVAVKVLPSYVAQDRDRRLRFEREARTIATLNHPHILAIHDVGEAEQLPFMITEYVDGESLRGPLSERKLLDIAVQIADALAAAHAAGIVHRDVKPDNLLLARDGRIKVLDFGLARELAPAKTATTLAVTEQGMLLGTVAYMSPEQVRGAPMDWRSDQFSFGLVLYELATGRQAFTRESAVQTLSAIIEAEPDVTPLAELSQPLRWIIERCLAKVPAGRYASTQDLHQDLRQLRDRYSELTRYGSPTGLAAPSATRSIRHVGAGLAAALLVIALAGFGGWRLGQTDRSGVLDRLTFRPLAVTASVETMPAWSPDGRTLAYAAEVDGYYQIFVRRLDQSTPTELTRIEGDCWDPQWDTSGTRVFFYVRPPSGVGEIWVTSAAGGHPDRIVENAHGFGLAPDGTSLVFSRRVADRLELWTSDMRGRHARRLPGRECLGSAMCLPRFSPDGRLLAMTDRGLFLRRWPVDAAQADEGRTVTFAGPGMNLSTIRSFAWLPDSRRVVLEGRGHEGGDPELWLGDVERGTAHRVSASRQWELMPAASPDGSRLAFVTTPMDWDVVEIELPSGTLRPRIATSRYDAWPVWLPSGDGLLFSTQRTGRFEIWSHAFRDGGERAIVTPEVFPDEPTFFLVHGAVSPDGRSVAYTRFSANGIRIYVSAMSGSKPVRLTADAEAQREDHPAWSPDGRWLLFRRGTFIFKALASGDSAAILIAENSATADTGGPKWLPDGSGIVYQSPAGLFRVGPDGGTPLLITQEQPRVWDLAPDGRAIHAIREGHRRAIELVRIDLASGNVQHVARLGRTRLSPDPRQYAETLRGLRVSPDGKRLVVGYLNATADIWILEGFDGR
jgi:eukaryotic-like serine/threonine-protein kinase